MTQTFNYDGGALSNVMRKSVTLTERADHGEVGTGTLTLDDDAGTVEIVGHKGFTSIQSSCSAPSVFRGYIAGRRYSRGETQFTGAGRQIEVSVNDLNDLLGFRVIRKNTGETLAEGGVRPRESIDDRLTWLLGSDFLGGLIADNGFVEYPSTMLDKNDYRGQVASDVLRDMAMVAKFNFFVYWDEAEDEASLWFADSNTSTDYTSSLSISNVMADVNSTTVFAPSQDAELTRDPSQTVTGVWLGYTNGHVYRRRTATETTYPRRDGVAPNAQVKKRSTAISHADKFLFERRNEEDTITVTLRLTAAKVNLVRAGMRIACKFSHFDTEGYGSSTYFRVLERTITHPMNDDNNYDVRLVLSPQEGGCSVEPTFIQYKYQDSTQLVPTTDNRFTLDAASHAGNLILIACIGDDLNVGQVLTPPPGWNTVFDNEQLKVGVDNWVHLFWKVSGGEQTATIGVEGVARGLRGIMIEYAGLTNPVLDSSTSLNREEGLGYANIPTTSYPAGAALALAITWMQVGPESGDAMTAGGGGWTLRTPQDSGAPGFFGAPCLAIADIFRDPADSSGSASSGQFLFTNDEPTLTVGLTFVGDNCE